MTASPASTNDRRALVLAPRGRDAAVVAQVLQSAGLEAVVHASLARLVDGLGDGAGLVVVTEEELVHAEAGALKAWLDAQPPWSDLPLVVLATKQPGRRSPQAQAMLMALGNVVLLERPLNAETLSSAARAALRSRQRQYEARSHLEQQQVVAQEHARLYQAERRALLQAAEAREALTLALDAAELGTFHCPMPLGPIVWNATCKAHFWLEPDAEVDFDRFYALIHEDDRERTRAAIAMAVDERVPYDVEYRTVSPDGRHRWLRAKGRTYDGADGQPLRFDGVTLDISRQKALEAERESLLGAERSARLGAEQASRVKDEFLATLSHELRTPLSAILGWAHVLKLRVQDSPELTRGLETIDRNARAQTRLVDDLLDMSRINAGNLQLEPQLLMPAAVIEAVVASLEPTAAAKHLHLERHVDADAGPVRADPQRFPQILWNLLVNAIKFTPPHGHVRVSLSAEDGQAVMRVSDDGEGIDPAFLPFMFDRFRQADGSTTRRHGGLGLGLAIVRHLAELHGGGVQAESAGLGRGATFTVRLPLQEAISVVPVEAAPSPDVHDGVDLDGLRILLVDDEPDGLEMIGRLLADSGAAVTPVGSAMAALAALEHAEADLLISDIGMPQVDGYQLLQQVRERGHTLPAIALTAFARNDDERRVLAAGFGLHLAKPVEPRALVSAVARLTRRQDARRGTPRDVRPAPQR